MATGAPNPNLDSLTLYDTLLKHAQTDPPIAKALEVLDGAIRLYPPPHLAVAFNGGKDATVVLHLTRAIIAHHARQNNTPTTLKCLYLILPPSEQFPAVHSFVRHQTTLYELDVFETPLDFKRGIQQFTRCKPLSAFIMGTRRQDPHGLNMEHFQPSSPGWPPFMRVNPILTWSYHDVWRFLRKFSLPYCELYDQGYTSVGTVSNTVPNPALRVLSNSHRISYKPAWMLEDASLERAGRIKKSNPPPQHHLPNHNNEPPANT